MHPGKPQFSYIKVGCKGVFITRTCFYDDDLQDGRQIHLNQNKYRPKFVFWDMSPDTYYREVAFLLVLQQCSKANDMQDDFQNFKLGILVFA